MKTIIPIITSYDSALKNDVTEQILSEFHSKERELFDRVKKGEENEVTLARQLYNVTPSHRTYQSLKEKLLEDLTKMVMLESRGTSIQQKKKQVLRWHLAVRILDILGWRPAMARLAQKTYRKAIHLEMHAEALDMARILSTHFAVYKRQKSAGEKYHVLCCKSMDIYRNEVEAEWLYAQAFHILARKSGIDKNQLALFADLADKIRDKLHPESHRTHFFYYQVCYMKHYISGNIAGRIQVARQALDHFNSLHIRHEVILSSFTGRLIESFIDAGQFSQAEALCKANIRELDDSYSRVFRMEQLFAIYLYQAKFDDAKKLFASLKKPAQKYFDHYKERILLYELYLGTFTNIRNLNIRRINYNLNRVKQDKAGLFIAHKIGNLLYQVMDGNDDYVIDNTEALLEYTRTYLQGKPYARTRYFIKIITSLYNGSEMSKWLEKLSKTNSAVKRGGIEVIQYEIILNMIFRMRGTDHILDATPSSVKSIPAKS